MARKKTADPEVADPAAPSTPKGKKKGSKSEAAPAVPVAPAAALPARPPPTRDEIAARALSLWRSGSADTVGNWLQAERELMAEGDA